MSGEGLSRRALLGAAVGFPLLPRHCEEPFGGAQGKPPVPGSDEAIQCGGGVSIGLLPPDRVRGRNDGEWDEALAALRSAQARVGEVEAATAGCGFEEEEALLPEHDSACEAMDAALGRLLLVPAPHLSALGVKFEAAFAHEIKTSAKDDPRFAAVLKDIVRLQGAERRPVAAVGPSRE